MSAGLNGFVQGISQAVSQAADRKYDEQQSQKKAQWSLYSKVAYDNRTEAEGGPSDAERRHAMDQVGKLGGKDVKQGNQKFSSFRTMLDAISGKGGQQPQVGGQLGAQPQSGGAQPPPQPQARGPLPAPAPPQGGMTENLPNGQPAPGTAGSRPMQSGPLAAPQAPAGPPQAATDQQIEGAKDSAAKAALERGKPAEQFKTDESIRKTKTDEENKAAMAKQQRVDALKEIESDPQLSPEDKKQARLQMYGITQAQASYQDVHYQDDKGEWHPAQHDPKNGTFLGVDRKPIDPATIKDVRPEPPAPEKPDKDSQEVRDLTQDFIAHGDKPDVARTKALDQRRKQLDTAQRGAEIRITNASNQGGGGSSAMSDDEFRTLAQREIQTKEKPSFGMGKSAERAKYNKILAQEWAKDPDSAQAASAFKAGTASLVQLEKMKGQIGAFEDAFHSDLELAREASKDVPRTSAKKFNSFAQLIKSNWTDDPELARLSVASQTAVNQYSRLVSSASAGGTSTDTARKEAIAILDKAMASGSFNAALDQMEKEAANRIKGIDTEIDKVKKGMRSPSSRGPLADPSKSPPPKTAEQYLQMIGH